MGSSFSTNVANSITRVISKISTQIVQNTQLTQDQSQIISVSNIDGDVHITGNVFTQIATVNMQALMSALTTTEAQQSIIQELAQEAKSITSGLNLAQFADSSNTINSLIEAEIDVLNEISQNCITISNQFQEIIVERVKGNVYIQNNVFDQMYNIFENCAQQVVTNNKEIQDALNKIAQSSSASSQGVSEWAVVAGLAIIFGLPIVGATIGGVAALKYIFPLILIVGIVLIIVYFLKGKSEMSLTGYSKLIRDTPICMYTPKDLVYDTSFKNETDAAKVCLLNSTCSAFDWIAGVVQQDGSFQLNPNPSSIFYTNVSKECQKAIQSDATKILYTPKMFKGTGNPTNIMEAKNGDLYMNTTTTEWFQLKNSVWQLKGTLTLKPFNSANWGTAMPISGQGNVNDVYFFTNNFSSFNVYRYGSNGMWTMEQTITGPGLVPSSLTPPNINTSGFKNTIRNQWLLYGGVTAVVVGAIGSFWTMNKTKVQK